MDVVKDKRMLTFKRTVSRIKKAGYDVYMFDGKDQGFESNYRGYITDGKNISIVDVDCLNNIHFVSVHKIGSTIGAGFSMDEDIKHFNAKTIKEKVKISFRHLPIWGEGYREYLRIYEDFEEFRRYKERYRSIKMIKL